MAKLVDEISQIPAGPCCAQTLATGLTADEAKALSEQFQVLAHPIRLQILGILARNPGQVCVCDLEAALPVKQPTISHHLKILLEQGLVGVERQGLWAYYFVQREAVGALSNWIVQGLSTLTDSNAHQS